MRTLKLVLILLTIIGINSAMAQKKKDLSTNNPKAMQTLGGVASEGNLRIYIYDNANMQVYRYVSGNWQNQWYGTSSKSIRLYAGGTAYAGSGGYFSSGATTLSTSSNTNTDANTNVLIMNYSGTVKVKQTTYYPAGSTNIYYTFEVTNLSGSTLNDLRLFSGGDTYLQGGDNGGGFWIAMDNTIGVKKTIGTNLQKLNMQGITIPYAYESDNYYNVYQNVNANALSNVIDANESTDNGMALEYRIPSLAAGSTWTIEAVEKFNASPITNVIVTAPLSGQVAPGNTLDLNFTLQNRTSNATSVTLTPTIDLSGWSVALISPTSPYNLAANETQTINLRVTCPSGTTLGTTAKITLTATDASGSASDFTNVTAAAVPTINTHPSDVSTCAGSPAAFSVTATNANTYQWQEYTTSWANISNGGIYSGATTANLSISSVSSGMNNYQYRCFISNTYGNATSNNGTLTIGSTPSITSQPSASTVCTGNNTSFTITASGSGLSYQWQVNTGSGYTNITNGGVYSGATTNTLSLTGVTSAMNGFLYKCIVNNTCSAGIASNAVALTVNSLPTITSQPSASTICQGSNTSFAVTATGTSLTYQWQVNTGSGFANITNGGVYSGATTNTLSITAATAGMNTYQYKCTVSGSCSPAVTSNSVILTVNSAPSISTQPSASTICQGTNTNFSVAATGTSLAYQWQVNTGSGFANITNGGVYSGATTNTLSITAATAGMNTYQYKCTVSGSCSPAITSNSVILTVNSAPSISTQPSASTVCPGDNTSFTVTATGTSLTYQWQVNTGSGFANITNGGVYSGATTNTLSITAATAGMNTYQYKCTVSGSCSPNAVSDVVILIVNSELSINVQPLPSVICEGSNASFELIASGTGLTYQWQVDEGSGFANIPDGGIYSGTTTNVLAITAATYSMNGYLYRCELSGTCSNTTSNQILLTINTLPFISMQPNASTICEENNTFFEIVASGTGITYQWQVNEGSGFENITDGGVYSGATTNTLSITAATTDMNNYEYKCEVSGSCSPNVVSDAALLTVYAAPSFTLQPLSSSVCEGSNTSFEVNASGAGLSYQWQVNEGSGFVNIIDGGIYNGANTNTLTITGITNEMNDFKYQNIVNGTCSPNIISETASLTVYELPIVNLGSDTLLCEDQVITLDAGPGINYVWSLPGLTGQIVTIDVSMVGLGSHQIGVTVTNSNNCEGEDVIEITFETCMGINNMEQSKLISIHPNPASGNVFISFPFLVNDAVIEIIDMQGRVVKKEKVCNIEETNIDLSNLIKGVYNVQIITNKLLINKKLIIN